MCTNRISVCYDGRSAIGPRFSCPLRIRNIFIFFFCWVLDHINNVNCFQGLPKNETHTYYITYLPTYNTTHDRQTSWRRTDGNFICYVFQIDILFYELYILKYTTKCQISTCIYFLTFLQITTPISIVYLLSLNNNIFI